MLHAWYIILENPDKVRVDDEERQIFIVSPSQTTHVVINKQPNQTRIKFNHPEPFLESSRHNSQNSEFNNNNLLNSNSLSPRSNTPLMKSQRSQYVASPLSRVENSYGAVGPNEGSSNYNFNYNDNDNDNNDDGEGPPSYENVMNETAKQYR